MLEQESHQSVSWDQVVENMRDGYVEVPVEPAKPIDDDIDGNIVLDRIRAKIAEAETRG